MSPDLCDFPSLLLRRFQHLKETPSPGCSGAWHGPRPLGSGVVEAELAPAPEGRDAAWAQAGLWAGALGMACRQQRLPTALQNLPVYFGLWRGFLALPASPSHGTVVFPSFTITAWLPAGVPWVGTPRDETCQAGGRGGSRVVDLRPSEQQTWDLILKYQKLFPGSRHHDLASHLEPCPQSRDCLLTPQR